MDEASPLIYASGEVRDNVHEKKSLIESARHGVVGLVTVGLLVIFASVAWSSSSNGHDRISLRHTSKISLDETSTHYGLNSRSSRDGSVSIDIRNEYSDRGIRMFHYHFLRDAYLMEPYRESMVLVSGLSDACGVHWNLSEMPTSSKKESKKSLKGYSDDVEVLLIETGATGKYRLTLRQECVKDSNHEFTVWVKYVRRELSSLTDRDREEFLDTLKVLWDVSTVEGRELYGPQYKSVQYLATIHNDGGANIACDEFHLGPGFLNNHVLLGAYLEQVLQLVNPRTCLHYMEYTKYFTSDAYNLTHRYNSNDGGAWTELMTAKWFGTSDPYTGHIIDGRWAGTQVPFLDDNFFHAHGIDKYKLFFPAESDIWFRGNAHEHYFNPYGLLRSPWNFSPDPYLLRFNNIDRLETTEKMGVSAVYCYDYENFIQSYVVGQSLETAALMMEGTAHNGAHFGIGGAGGDLNQDNDALLTEEYGFTPKDLMYTTYQMQEFRKTTFAGFLSGAETILKCSDMPYDYYTSTLSSTAPPGSEDGMSCVLAPHMYNSEKTIDEFFIELYGTDGPAAKTNDYIFTMDKEKKKGLMELLASRYQYNGDLASSSAALDPIFWVFHGSVERLFQRIVFENVLTDMNYTYDTVCSGHRYDGTKPWLQGFQLEDRSVDVTLLTNQDFVQILNPKSDLYAEYLNFVYDSRDWDWCEGFDSFFS